MIYLNEKNIAEIGIDWEKLANIISKCVPPCSGTGFQRFLCMT